MDFKDVMIQRRSVNFFDPEKDVPDPLLREMIELGSKAPSGFNLQPWSLMVLKDRASKEKLLKLAWNQTKIVEAPVVMIVLADRENWMEGHPTVERNFKEMAASGAEIEEQRSWILEAAKKLYGSSEERKIAFACKNTGFFAMSLMLAAKSLGLDTHPMDGFDIDGTKEAFNIPDRFWIPLLLAVGYFNPEAVLEAPKWRKSYDDIVVSFP